MPALTVCYSPRVSGLIVELIVLGVMVAAGTILITRWK